MKLAILCNSRLAIPTISTLLQAKVDISIGIPEKSSEDTEAIKALAKSFGIEPQIISKRKVEKDIRQWFLSQKPQAALVMTFPYIIPDSLIYEAPLGWYNFHFAPLPTYRGPEPIFWLIKNRETHGAVTIHKISSTLDAGPIVIEEKVPLEPTDTHGVHLQKLSYTAPNAAGALLQMLHYHGRFVPARDQNESLAKSYPRAKVEDLTINWENTSSEDILALIRACNPWNKGAFSFIQNIPLKITQARLAEPSLKTELQPGQISTVNDEVLVGTIDTQNIVIEIISTDEGIFTARQFDHIYNIDKRSFTNNSLHFSLT